MNDIELSSVIKKATQEVYHWGFNTELDSAEENSKNTVSAKIIEHIYYSISDINFANKTIGLLTTYLARRSLVCWFLYCNNEDPLNVTYRLEDYWLSSYPDDQIIDPKWCRKTEPTDRNGIAIKDCRWSDTFSSSSSVSFASCFADNNKPLNAILSLSNAYIAFDCSPIGSYLPFERWIAEVAFPCALEGRAMPNEELFALADFEIPEVMLKSRD